MNKSLLKNEFIKVMRFSGRAKDKKSGVKSVVGYLVLMAVIGVLFAAMTYFMFDLMAPQFLQYDFGWLCFTYAAIMAVIFAVVGSVFMAQSQLYRAKDNDLLLSLPIPSWQILFCRMLPLYVQNFYFCFIVLVPAYVAFCVYGGFTVLGLIFVLIDLFAIPLFSLTLCCLLGFIVAFIASRVKHANVITAIISVVLFVAYFVVCTQLSNILLAMIEGGEQAASGIMAFAYPLYLVGRTAEGDWLGVLVTFLIGVIPFALLYLLLSKTYIGIITRKGSAAKSVYKQKMVKRGSEWGVLIGKESKRFFRSTAYLLNCGLGVIMLFIAAVAMIIFVPPIVAQIEGVYELLEYLPPIACLFICTISAMDAETAPSVSLEGKSLYVLQSLPIESYKPLFAKIFFYVIYNAPMAVICGVVAAIVLKASAISAIMLILMPIAVNFLFGALGLVFNLLKPMLDWDNETTVIKQSISVLFQMLAVLVIFGALTAIAFAADLVMPLDIYLLICFALISAGAVGAMVWVKKRGSQIWENL